MSQSMYGRATSVHAAGIIYNAVAAVNSGVSCAAIRRRHTLHCPRSHNQSRLRHSPFGRVHLFFFQLFRTAFLEGPRRRHHLFGFGAQASGEAAQPRLALSAPAEQSGAPPGRIAPHSALQIRALA